MANVMKVGVVLCFLALLAHGKDLRDNSEDGDAPSCGYSSCNAVKEDMLNVHIVPHTHDDVGWLSTVDQYYYQEVQFILDSVIPELEKDPNKRFIYVEIAFFARWFREQDEATRRSVKQLVNQGRLEFILGGWCMNDEASTHYNAIIDQHSLGFDFLRQNFGKCAKPRVGWQIDPFGHSREQASLFAQFGFDSLFFGRLDYQDKELRQNHSLMEMVWRGSPNNLGVAADLFTGVNENGYGPPSGFCFDITCGGNAIVDDPRLHDVNVDTMVDSFLKAMDSQAKHFTTNHLMATMGSDFQYQAAHNWFLNLDKLIHYVNARQSNGSKVNLLYSTPSCYTYQLNLANKTWTVKADDFFPYASRPHSFWTGYFTSRAALKGYARRTNNFFQVVKQLDVLALLQDSATLNTSANINVLAEALGVVQHHDAISGTEKQAVAYDYTERIANGVHEAQKVYTEAIDKLIGHNSGMVTERSYCPLLNISVCPASESALEFRVTVYNPIARGGQWYVRLPVSSPHATLFNVTGPAGEVIANELIPVVPDTRRIPERQNNTASYELVFPVTLVPLGYSVYTVKRYPGFQKAMQKKSIGAGPDVVFENEYVSVAFDGTSGMLKNMTNLEKKISINVTQYFGYYRGMPGNNSQPQWQASGAYIFRPNGSAIPVFPSGGGNGPRLLSNSYFVKGELVQELYTEFNPWITQTVKLYAGQRYVHFQWTVGPIPIKDNVGKEVISRFQTSLENDQIFYTDANGREILKRKLNHRETWAFNNTEPVSGNYYPVNSRIYIQDKEQQIQFTVLNDRSQGGSSLQDGQLELMVHRRLLHDDSLGVGEPLNETGSDGHGLIVRGSHYITLEPVPTAAAGHRDLGERLFMSPDLSFSGPLDVAAEKLTWSGVRQALPDNVHLLTLERYRGSGPVGEEEQPYLLRLEHFYEAGEDDHLSKPVVVDVKDLFTSFTVTKMTELTLGADLALSELERLHWDYPHPPSSPGNPQDSALKFQSEKKDASSNSNPFQVSLSPMQIRTFQINIKPRSH